MENLIDIIQKHSLTVRCLPHEVISCWTYKEGDENLRYVDSNGNEIKDKREVIIQDYDLEHFKREVENEKKKPAKWRRSDSPEKRFENWKKNFPNGRKLLKVTKKVEHGGWWLVKQTLDTGSHVIFNMEHDFFAPTLEEALNLYLKSIGQI